MFRKMYETVGLIMMFMAVGIMSSGCGEQDPFTAISGGGTTPPPGGGSGYTVRFHVPDSQSGAKFSAWGDALYAENEVTYDISGPYREVRFENVVEGSIRFNFEVSNCSADFAVDKQGVHCGPYLVCLDGYGCAELTEQRNAVDNDQGGMNFLIYLESGTVLDKNRSTMPLVAEDGVFTFSVTGQPGSVAIAHVCDYTDGGDGRLVTASGHDCTDFGQDQYGTEMTGDPRQFTLDEETVYEDGSQPYLMIQIHFGGTNWLVDYGGIHATLSVTYPDGRSFALGSDFRKEDPNLSGAYNLYFRLTDTGPVPWTPPRE